LTRDDRFSLDPSRFPQRLDLDLPADVLQRLEALARRRGRSVKDMAADLLSQAIGDSRAVNGN